MNNELSEHVKALLTRRNGLAQEVNTNAEEMIGKKAELDKNHKSDCPCRTITEGVKGDCGDTVYSDGMKELEIKVKEQTVKRAELDELDELIDSGEAIEERVIKSAPTGPVTEAGMTPALASLIGNGKKDKFMSRIGVDFWEMLQKLNLTKKDDIKGRPTLGAGTGIGSDRFNCVASFYAAFGNNAKDIASATKSIAGELALGADFDTAMQTRRNAFKSMFTQHPLAGGDGSLYAPTEVFPGNTGGLCEYQIDDTLDVLPYPPASFLDCIPVRTISKSWLLYARQTLRVNNASGVGEGVVLTGSDNPTEAPVDFRPIKPESQFGFSQAKAYTITFADTLPVSEEFLEDCPAVADAVETQLMENVRQEFYNQLINGDGSDGENPEILGLLSQVGLSTRVHRGAATFFGNTMGAGGADDDMRETLERAIFDAQAYGYTVDCAIVSYDDYVDLTFVKNEDGLRLYTDEQTTNVRGVRIRPDVRMAAGTAIIGAFRQTVQILMRRAIRLDIGWTDKQFLQDMLTLRATMRAGLLAKAPHALIRVTGI